MKRNEILGELSAPPAGALKAGGKLLGKALPGVGLALAAQDAYSRQQSGDTTGAAISGLTGAASTIPVVGTAAALLGTGVQAVRDKFRTGSWLPDEQEIAAASAKDKAAVPAQAAAKPAAPVAAQAAAKPAAPVAAPAARPGVDPKVQAIQQQLIAKGAKIKADGVMGPATQAAMKQFGMAAESKTNKGTVMSESEKIAGLRDRLKLIESTQVNEGPMDLLKGAWQGAKNIGSAFKAGVSDPAMAKALAPAATKTGEKAALATGAAVARNPGKVAAGAGAAGALGAAALAGGGATQPAPAVPGKPPVGGATQSKPPGAPAAPAAPAAAQPAVAGPDPKEVEELNALAAEFENSQDPAIIALMQKYNGVINAVNNRAKGDKRSQAEIAASAALSDAGV